jgi:heme-degrading monooxygenase HmoA
MFARKVSMQLKSGGASEFKQKIENEVIPLLRKQKGFLDEITFLYPNGKEVHAFSLWETAEAAEAYNRGSYPAVTKILASIAEGSPRVQTYEVLNSTFHKTAALAAIA